MNVLILGGGGREHALAWKISGSPLLETLYLLPGNPGMARLGVNIAGDVKDKEFVKQVVLTNQIDMVVVGPEDPLVGGIHDFFLNDDSLSEVIVIGPESKGALLEGSKDFAKQFMERHGIPTAGYRSFTGDEIGEAQTWLRRLRAPYVLKADGLAAGKGVVIHSALSEAEKDLRAMLLDGKFGKAGSRVVVEEFLDGIEMSVFVLTDGDHYLMLPEAKDYKKIGEGNTGLNTGGMGTLSPVPFYNLELRNKVEERIIRPTIEGLKKDGICYKGFIFFGLMVVDGDPLVIEYNVRLGDPEAESILPRIDQDLLPLLKAVGDGSLREHTLSISDRHVATVRLVSGGYPGDYPKGKEICIAGELPGSVVFHSGTALNGNTLVTGGGRVIAVTCAGDSLTDALEKCYQQAENISFEGKYYREDIGQDVLPFVS